MRRIPKEALEECRDKEKFVATKKKDERKKECHDIENFVAKNPPEIKSERQEKNVT